MKMSPLLLLVSRVSTVSGGGAVPAAVVAGVTPTGAFDGAPGARRDARDGQGTGQAGDQEGPEPRPDRPPPWNSSALSTSIRDRSNRHLYPISTGLALNGVDSQ